MTKSNGNLRLVNDSKYSGNRDWKWSVWVEGPEQKKMDITSVTYYLHPTFQNPIIEVTDKDTNFKLRGSGWGEFNVKAELSTKSGETVTLNHWLEFDREKRKGTSVITRGNIFISHSAADGHMANLLARHLIEKKYNVTASATIDIKAGSDWRKGISGSIKQADVVVVLISQGMSEFMVAEISQSRFLEESSKGKLIPVVLGSANVDEYFMDFQQLQISSSKEVNKVVEAVERMMQDQSDH